jgi:hypothetical protein
MKYLCFAEIFTLCFAVEYPYYVESIDSGNTWSEPSRLPAISDANFCWYNMDCEVINNQPFAVHVDSNRVIQLFYPYPDNPGNPGNWNWAVLDVAQVGEGSFAWHDTTWTLAIDEYPNISFDPDRNLILVSYKCNFSLNPPPFGWNNGNYLGGILSTDGGRNWLPCRPLSGPLLPTPGGPIEVAHRLVTLFDTSFVYATWTDAGEGEIGDQYFELGIIQSIWWWDNDDSRKTEPVDNHQTHTWLMPGLNLYKPRTVVVGQAGDEKSILGPAGKNICVASDGNTIAIVYGEPSDPYDPNQPLGDFHVTYSTNRGITWNAYGPFNVAFGSLCSLYPSVDGCDNFCTEAGNLFFAWQEGQIMHNPNLAFVIFEENVPASPSFTSPIELTSNIFPWMPCIGVNPDNNNNVMVTAWSSLAWGNNANYAWISSDGGYTWGDTITMTPPIDTSDVSIGAGHFRWGTGGYAFFTYHDEYDPAIEEQTVKSTPKIHLEVQPTIVNRHCHISFTKSREEKVSLKLFDVTGTLIQAILDECIITGRENINLDFSELRNGIYIVRLESNELKESIKLIKVH